MCKLQLLRDGSNEQRGENSHPDRPPIPQFARQKPKPSHLVEKWLDQSTNKYKIEGNAFYFGNVR